MVDWEDGRSLYLGGILEQLHLPLTSHVWTLLLMKKSKALTYLSHFWVAFLFLAIECAVSGLKSTQCHQIFS